MKMCSGTLMDLSPVKTLPQYVRIFAASTVGPRQHRRRRLAALVNSHEPMPKPTQRNGVNVRLGSRTDSTDRFHDSFEQFFRIKLYRTNITQHRRMFNLDDRTGTHFPVAVKYTRANAR